METWTAWNSLTIASEFILFCCTALTRWVWSTEQLFLHCSSLWVTQKHQNFFTLKKLRSHITNPGCLGKERKRYLWSMPTPHPILWLFLECINKKWFLKGKEETLKSKLMLFFFGIFNRQMRPPPILISLWFEKKELSPVVRSFFLEKKVSGLFLYSGR